MDRTYLVFTGFGSSEHGVWDDDLLSRFGLTNEKLPTIVEPWDIIGSVQPQWAEAIGLAPGTPIASGCGDQSANVLGAGLVDPGAEKLIFLPHMSGRNTPNDPDMRGAFLGLTWRHEKPHMVRAIMESIAYEYALYLRAVREIAPGFHPKHAVNIGGGAKSKVLRQIKADALGLDYHSMDREEFGTLGAAIVAGHAVGLFSNLAETARRFAGETRLVASARPEITARYAPSIDAYIDALETLSPLFARLGRTLNA